MMRKGDIVLLVFKETGSMVMGKVFGYTEGLENILIEDYKEIRFMQSGPNSMSPVPLSFPAPFVDSLLTDEGANISLDIKGSDVYFYPESLIKKDALDLYRSAIAKRSGIEIAQSMPKGNSMLLKG